MQPSPIAETTKPCLPSCCCFMCVLLVKLEHCQVAEEVPPGVIAVSTSLSSRNEPGNTGLHYGIKSDPQLDSFANLPHGLFGKGGDFKVLLDPAGGLRGGQEGRPALDGPGEQDLRRGLVDSLGDRGNDSIFQQLGLATMPQRCERLQHDAILFAIVQKVPLREIRMGFDVNNCRLDPPRFKDLLSLAQADVGYSDGLALAFVP